MDELTRLAVASRDGDLAAFAGFVRLAQPQVWRLCRHLTDHDSAADCTQETFLRAFRSLPSFAGRSSARTWLLTIARRTCADHIRARCRSRALLQAASEPLEPDPAEGLALHWLLDVLDDDRRTAFVCTQLLGLSYAETAEVCHVPVGTIRSRVARARGQLIEALDNARRDRPSSSGTR
jgi:RNA polymerase sigma-70 factor (ECF subfamily)